MLANCVAKCFGWNTCKMAVAYSVLVLHSVLNSHLHAIRGHAYPKGRKFRHALKNKTRPIIDSASSLIAPDIFEHNSTRKNVFELTVSLGLNTLSTNKCLKEFSIWLD